MATNQKAYYRITETGTELVQETIHECPIDDAVLQRYATEKVVKVHNLFNPALVGAGISHGVALSVKGKVHCFTLRLSELTIQTRFSEQGGLMVPDFSALHASSTALTMRWPVPDDMKLFLMVQVNPETLQAGESWLLAYNTQSYCYRLPTSNIYEDGKVCQGKYDNYGGSLLECLIKAYAQFLASPWNDHLTDRGGKNGMDNSKAMFRFKALEPDGFEAVPPDRSWFTLSTKINNEFVNSNICNI